MNQLNQYRFLEKQGRWGVRHVQRVRQVIPQSICNCCCCCCCCPMKRAADPQTVAKYFKIAKRLQWNRRQQQLIQLSNTTTTTRRRKGDQCEDVAQSHFYLTASASEFPQPQRAWWQPWPPQAPTAGQQSSLQKLGAQRKLRHRNGERGMGSYAKPGERKWQKQVSEWESKEDKDGKQRRETTETRCVFKANQQQPQQQRLQRSVNHTHSQSLNQSINQSIERAINQQ